MEIFKNSGQFLKKLRSIQGATQQEIANVCDIHVQYVSNYERGKCLPPRHALKKLVKVLKMTDLAKAKLLEAINEDMTENNKRVFKDLL